MHWAAFKGDMPSLLMLMENGAACHLKVLLLLMTLPDELAGCKWINPHGRCFR